MLTYITTYYDDVGCLDHLQQLMAGCSDPRLQMIIVDDFSDKPIDNIVKSWNDPRVRLFRVTEDMGFNSHGARNLAMQQTNTEWNVLIDVDYKLVGVDILLQQLENNELEEDIPHFFGVVHSFIGKTKIERASVNDFLVSKTLYWKAKGYDPEYIGFHAGDRRFITRLHEARRQPVNSMVIGPHLEALRSPYTKTIIDKNLKDVKSEYFSINRDIMYIAPGSELALHNAELQCDRRHVRGEDADPTPFKWEQQI